MSEEWDRVWVSGQGCNRAGTRIRIEVRVMALVLVMTKVPREIYTYLNPNG